MRIGVVGTSTKANERRVPLHPAHLARIPGPLRGRLVFEEGYAAPFGWSDARLAAAGIGGLAPRASLLAELDALILPKPSPADLHAMREGAVLWGWPHAVQQREIARAAVDRRLTLVAFEQMHEWLPDGRRGPHVFRRNNELAGYCVVLHAMGLKGIDGHFGPPRRVVVLGAGACAGGALRGLRALGFTDVTACHRGAPPADPAPGVAYQPVRRSAADPARMVAIGPGGAETPLLDLLAAADVVINAVQQDPLAPVTFVDDADLAHLRPGCLILDISCDAGMGFAFARPTGFDAPFREVGACAYYAVDHAPSHLWEAASWEISEALLPHLAAFAAGPPGWAASVTLARAVDVEEGRITNPAVRAFQERPPAWV